MYCSPCILLSHPVRIGLFPFALETALSRALTVVIGALKKYFIVLSGTSHIFTLFCRLITSVWIFALNTLGRLGFRVNSLGGCNKSLQLGKRGICSMRSSNKLQVPETR
jgi:hypothetical protein